MKPTIKSLTWLAAAWILLGCSLFQSLAEKALQQPTPTGRISPQLATPTQPLTTEGLAGQQSAMLASEATGLTNLDAVPIYHLSIEIDYEARTFKGHSALDLTNLEDIPLESVYFRMLPNGGKSYGPGRMELTAARVDGAPVEADSPQDATIIQIPLSKLLEVGDRTLIEFEFIGEVPFQFGGEKSGGYGIFNFSEGVMALSGWFPILAVYDQDGWNLDPVSAIGDSVYSDIAFYNVEITVPANMTVIATGVETGREEAENRMLHRYVSGPVRDFFIILGPDFQVSSGEVDGTQVNAYTLQGHQAAGEQALEIALDSVQIFNQDFGPYPYVELDVVEAPMRGALGVEFPGVVLVASQLYDQLDDSFIIATSHEVAHQWWYNLVGNDVFDEPWLDEALATYSSAVYYEAVYGEEAYRGFAEYWQDRYQRLVESGADEPIMRNLEYFESLGNPGVYGGVAYTKGALFLKALREEIGDDAFFRALQRYYAGRRYQIATASDLLDAFESAAGKDLDSIYDKWLYSPEK